MSSSPGNPTFSSIYKLNTAPASRSELKLSCRVGRIHRKKWNKRRLSPFIAKLKGSSKNLGKSQIGPRVNPKSDRLSGRLPARFPGHRWEFPADPSQLEIHRIIGIYIYMGNFVGFLSICSETEDFLLSVQCSVSRREYLAVFSFL
ncbi:hypothetical protein L6164_008112 [Bauhinia variegata]|uniref:Uncharacterized protein n=1 Tax=Bauhinia variegata TaxID=167791 RepID=A0ACB9PEW1_BAUVA|nr:hypothetical protein L6164_008112 [Bauhinia variegata]